MSGPPTSDQNESETLTFVVPADLDGERADKVLARLASISRSVSRHAIEDGLVTVGPGAALLNPSGRLAAGTELSAELPDSHLELEPEQVPFEVTAEGAAYRVVNKPSGVVVHPGAGRAHGSLAAGLLHRFEDTLGPEHRWGIVHRLDVGTSGLLVVARTPDAWEKLQSELRERRVKRTYLALVDGEVAVATGTIDAPLGRDPRRPTRRAVVHDGRPARTHYRRLAVWDDVSLLEIDLETGRTHQIRVHCASIGHPVVGDRLYGSPKSAARRIWLHAARLVFDDPAGEGQVVAAAELPDELAHDLTHRGVRLSPVGDGFEIRPV